MILQIISKAANLPELKKEVELLRLEQEALEAKKNELESYMNDLNIVDLKLWKNNIDRKKR